MSKFYHAHLITPNSLTVVFDHGPPINLLKSNDRFEHIKGLLQSGQFDKVPEELDAALKIRQETRGKFTVVNGAVTVGGEIVPKALSDKLLEFVDAGLDTAPLERFWANLQGNPSDSAREDLFAFLEANLVPLTNDGCFIAYKKVRKDFYDVYSGTYLNTPGTVVSMPRESVDKDRRNTCSRGLHVAAWEYASTFSGQRLLEVKVNPADVVAVPPDYNLQKMRTCRYLVLREATEKYTRSIFEEALVDKTIRDLPAYNEFTPSSVLLNDDYEEDDDWFDDWYDDEDEDEGDLNW